MTIAVVTEVSTREKNKLVLEALSGTGHEVLNVGMTGIGEEQELTYIQTGLISALLLATNAVELVVGGCGTGQGYLNSVLQYPGVACGLIESPLDAWLFRQINGGNCLSLALNKGFGWAGEVNLKFIFERFFSVPSGLGYPPHRMESQQKSRAVLEGISIGTHLPMERIVAELPQEVALSALRFPGVMELLRERATGHAVLTACEQRLG